jgi:hypothetical protein
MVVNGYSNNTRLKTHDPNWVTLGYQPGNNAEDYREMLRGQRVDDEPLSGADHTSRFRLGGLRGPLYVRQESGQQSD